MNNILQNAVIKSKMFVLISYLLFSAGVTANYSEFNLKNMRFEYDNEIVAEKLFPKTQSNRVLTAISGRVVRIESTKNGKMIELQLINYESHKFWISTFLFDKYHNDFKPSINDVYRVLGVVSDISNNLEIFAISQSQYVLSSYCLFDERAGLSLQTIDECENWKNGDLSENAEID